MRVLHVVAADRWTGAAAVALQLAEAQREAGLEVAYCCRRGDTLAARLVGREWACPLLVKERGLSDLAASVAVVRELAQGSDVVHAHLPHDHMLARFALRTLPGPALVRSVRRERHLRRDPLQRWLFRYTAGVGLCHEGLEARAARMLAGSDAAIRVLPPMAPRGFVPIHGREATRARLGVPAGVTVAGTVGKLDRRRGQATLLHALAAAPGVWGVIVGDGGRRPALERLAARLGVAERVVFAGFVGAGLADLLAAFDLFVFPAAGSDHGHRAIVEATASGLPTLAADLPGVGAVVRPGETGALYPPGDVAALAALVRSWAADAPRREHAHQAARAVAAGWTGERLAAVAADLYRGALERHGAGGRGS
jgi:glycosyltransferase involved in cell wall biosynthesis